MKLILGVNDIPYSIRPTTARIAKPQRKRKRPLKKPGGQASMKTTGDVAEILESKYHVMRAFADLYQPEIIDALEDSLKGAIESMAMGAPASLNPAGKALSSIEQEFRKAIDDQMFDGLIPGVPAKAAIRGVNHRLAHPYRRSNPERPTFRDTGLYQASFRAWIEP